MLLDYIMDNRKEILDIFKKHGASNVVIIGSVSRREETSESDIDFVANLKKDGKNNPDLQAHTDLIIELKKYFNGRKIELASHEQIECQYPNALSRGISL
ncbi:DNA polymerase beta domain-containing protein [Niallia nealsonii AAU1]|nr:DNA polymerase beta domain-containing protein [Niallia nealsonii AAU1]